MTRTNSLWPNWKMMHVGIGAQKTAFATTGRRLAVACLCGMLAGCGSGRADVETADRVPVNLEKSNEQLLLRYYLGGYVSDEGDDPEALGLLITEDGMAINPQLLEARHRQQLRDSDGNGEIGWDEFEAFVRATYADARGLPRELEDLRRDGDWRSDLDAWFSVDVDGVMTEARRRVYIRNDAIRAPLLRFRHTDGAIRYQPGTLIVGEHLDGQTVLETTIKRRRADGFWDFAVYDRDGMLAPGTTTGPRNLQAPTQCVGCHLGQRAFDPEKSFPASAPDGPSGPRTIHVGPALRNLEVTALFEEHTRRSDGVLGLYATLYTARLVADREQGLLGEADLALLESLGL